MPLRLKYSLIALFLLAVWGIHAYDKYKAVEAARTSLVLKYEKKLSDAATAARNKEQQMQKDADANLEKKNEEIQDIDRKLNTALNELRKRPKRPTNPPKDSTVAEACTGAKLYGEDAEFLAREAARADRILTERDYYYDQYESVRRRMEEATN